MRHLLFIMAMSFGMVVTAQDIQDESEIQAKEKREKKDRNEIKTLTGDGHSGGFFGLTFTVSEFDTEPVVMSGIRAGWIAGRAMGIGFEAHGIVPTAKFDQIVPGKKVVLLGGYGGMFLEPILFSNQVVHLTFPVAAGSGWLGYHEDWSPDYTQPTNLVDDDLFWYVEPGVSVELNVAKNFRLAFGGSQRFTKEMDLMNTYAGAFNKRSYYITLKFGKF
ncbi:MAG: hypothetical protein OEY34_08050 [Cyclobacteriaceae bacterium]|nr:hypothetical protein [Cyclobacteriaceae bacterium]